MAVVSVDVVVVEVVPVAVLGHEVGGAEHELGPMLVVSVVDVGDVVVEFVVLPPIVGVAGAVPVVV